MVRTRGSQEDFHWTVNTANPCELHGTRSLCKHLALGVLPARALRGTRCLPGRRLLLHRLG